MFYMIALITVMLTEGTKALGRLLWWMFRGLFMVLFFPFALVVELARTDEEVTK